VRSTFTRLSARAVKRTLNAGGHPGLDARVRRALRTGSDRGCVSAETSPHSGRLSLGDAMRPQSAPSRRGALRCRYSLPTRPTWAPRHSVPPSPERPTRCGALLSRDALPARPAWAARHSVPLPKCPQFTGAAPAAQRAERRSRPSGPMGGRAVRLGGSRQSASRWKSCPDRSCLGVRVA
jgi:hypothetical protein